MTSVLATGVRACLVAVALVAGSPWARAQEALPPDLGRWVARCDATVCKASLTSTSGNEALLIARWADGDGFAIGIATPRSIADRDRSIDLRIDSGPTLVVTPTRDYAPLERAESFWIVDARLAASVIQGAIKASQIRISYLDVIGAPHDADFVLDGLAKLLDTFDARLGKTGSRRTGVAPPKTLAPPPVMTRAELVQRMGLPDRLLARHRAARDCEDPTSPLLKPIPPVIGPLSKTAMLYAIPCSSSAGNVAYRLWVIETGEIGGITALYFASYDEVFGWKGSDLLFNVTFDPANARLVSQQKGAGDAGCGNRGVWRWKDYAFMLEEFRFAAACGTPRAASDFPRIYPAK